MFVLYSAFEQTSTHKTTRFHPIDHLALSGRNSKHYANIVYVHACTDTDRKAYIRYVPYTQLYIYICIIVYKLHTLS